MGRAKRMAIFPDGAFGTRERAKRPRRARSGSLKAASEGLVAKPVVPKSKHHTYFEFVENKDKKKKLESQVYASRTPPPGFEFVPIGNPSLTSACKELSRKKEAMIFIVSNIGTNSLSQQVNRLGHHVRQTIFEEAKLGLADLPRSAIGAPDGKPEEIPESEAEYHAQADAALRDLFPRIPNTDRQMIIEHAFTRRAHGRGEQPAVGFSDDIPLARRVQLAVLAHIRHAHTRYDELLREAGWQAARKAVESLCLDIIVKWRGDEETGRDQLDEILREVVIISDSESDSFDDESTDDSSADDESGSCVSVDMSRPPGPVLSAGVRIGGASSSSGTSTGAPGSLNPGVAQNLVQPDCLDGRGHPRNQRGFKRYQAWQDAILRNREPGMHDTGHRPGDASKPQALNSAMHLGPDETQARSATYHANPPYERIDRDVGLQVSSDCNAGTSPSFSLPAGCASLHRRHAVEIQSHHVKPNALALGRLQNISVSSPSPSPSPSPSRMVSSPVLHRLRDVLVPSIEPTSPEIMRPAFVRAVPPRNHEPVDNLYSQSRPSVQQARSLSPSHGFHRAALDQDRSLAARNQAFERPENGRLTLNDPVHWSQGHIFGPPQSGDGPSRLPLEANHPRAARIIVNASRPGTRSNPIIMEDRGGFYERISILQEPGWIDYPGRNMCASPQMPYTATRAYRTVSAQQGPQTLHHGRDMACVEAPLPLYSGPASMQEREGRCSQPNVLHGPPLLSSSGTFHPYPPPPPPPTSSVVGNGTQPASASYVVHQHQRPGQQGVHRSGEGPIHDYRGSYGTSGKRPLYENHHEEVPMERRSRPRQSYHDDVIVLD